MLHSNDPRIAALIQHEEKRQHETINLIASENYTPQPVLDAVGSVLTNKYAEGYPGKRYYAGCEYVDDIEELAIQRCKELFHAEHVNVQPHAGSQANMAAYMALLNPGDTIMGLDLAAGGHLTHGLKVNFSGVFYNAVSYSVDPETEQLDYNEIERLAHEYKPRLIIAGASAYPRTIDFKQFRRIADTVGAYFLADIAHTAGLIAAGYHQSPIAYADCITSTTHKTLRGPRGGLIMSSSTYARAIDKAIMPGIQGGPLMHAIAGKAVAFLLAQKQSFQDYQHHVIRNAQAMADEFKRRGYRLVADGTDTHLLVVDLRNKNVTGKQAEEALAQAGITLSRSGIPFDPEKPWITSGIRIGTAAITTRGMQENDCRQIVEYVDEVIKHINSSKTITRIAKNVRSLALQYS